MASRAQQAMLAACSLPWCCFSDPFRNSLQVRRRRPRRLLHRLVAGGVADAA